MKNQRYSLHRKLKRRKIKYSASKKTIYVYFENTDLPECAQILRDKFGYSIQTTITKSDESI